MLIKFLCKLSLIFRSISLTLEVSRLCCYCFCKFWIANLRQLLKLFSRCFRVFTGTNNLNFIKDVKKLFDLKRRCKLVQIAFAVYLWCQLHTCENWRRMKALNPACTHRKSCSFLHACSQNTRSIAVFEKSKQTVWPHPRRHLDVFPASILVLRYHNDWMQHMRLQWGLRLIR